MRDGRADPVAVHENGHAVIPEAEPKEGLHFEVFALRCYAFRRDNPRWTAIVPDLPGWGRQGCRGFRRRPVRVLNATLCRSKATKTMFVLVPEKPFAYNLGCVCVRHRPQDRLHGDTGADADSRPLGLTPDLACENQGPA